MTLENIGLSDDPIRILENRNESGLPELTEKTKLTEEEELKLRLDKLNEMLENEKGEMADGIVGSEKRVRQLEIMIGSLEKKLAGMT